MIYFTSTLLNIIVYLVTFAVMWHVFRKREERLMWDYQVSFLGVCFTFSETMKEVTKALEAMQEEDDEDYDGTYPCDIDGANK